MVGWQASSTPPPGWWTLLISFVWLDIRIDLGTVLSVTLPIGGEVLQGNLQCSVIISACASGQERHPRKALQVIAQFQNDDLEMHSPIVLMAVPEDYKTSFSASKCRQ